MKTLKYILFIITSLLVFQGCSDDEKNQSVFADDELPRIFMEQWAGTQTVKKGGTVKWNPEVSPSDGATYKWTLDGEVISTEKAYEQTFPELGIHELKFEVTRNGVVNSRVAKLLVVKPFEPKEYNKKSIAYIDVFEGKVDDIDWNTVTHVVISSSLVKETRDENTGELLHYVDLKFEGATLDIDNLVAIAHNYGVHVSLQISGVHDKLNGLPAYGAYDFYNIAINTEIRDLVITQVLDFVSEKNIDGVDIYFDKAHDGAFADPAMVKAFYTEFSNRIPEKNGEGKPFLLSASVVVGWTRAANAVIASIDRYDWVTFLAFAQEDLVPSPQSSTWSCSDNAAYWTGAGLPAEKVVVGCPAFSVTYDLKGNTPTWSDLANYLTYAPYYELFASFPDAQSVNSQAVADGLFYDGFPAIEEKAEMVKNQNYGGMALWKVNFDSKEGNKSLMKKMNEALGNRYYTQ